jgi:hypothetical protein
MVQVLMEMVPAQDINYEIAENLQMMRNHINQERD